MTILWNLVYEQNLDILFTIQTFPLVKPIKCGDVDSFEKKKKNALHAYFEWKPFIWLMQ